MCSVFGPTGTEHLVALQERDDELWDAKLLAANNDRLLVGLYPCDHSVAHSRATDRCDSGL